MTAIGGSIESCSINGRNFPADAAAEAQRQIGGFENEVMSNGDSSARLIKTRMPLMIENLVVSIDDDNGDQEFLQSAADATDYFDFEFTLVDGNTYEARAQITGPIQYSTQNATAALTFKGPGTLRRQ